MPIIDDLYVLSDFVYQKLVTNAGTLGLEGTFYGDQSRIPASPIACVEPDKKTMDIVGAQRQVETDFRIYVLTYSAFVDSPDQNRREADQLAEKIAVLLNADPFCRDSGGNMQVNHSFVAEIASGYTQKAGAIWRSSRILFTAKSKTRLPMG